MIAEKLNHVKAISKNDVSIALLGIAFTIFTLIATIKPELLRNNYLSLQLALSIPLFISSILSRLNMIHHHDKAHIFDTWAFINFTFAYSFLINIIGLLLDYLVSFNVAMTFFAVNVFSGLAYSTIEIVSRTGTWKEHIFKDSVFIILIILLGILPSIYA